MKKALLILISLQISYFICAQKNEFYLGFGIVENVPYKTDILTTGNGLGLQINVDYKLVKWFSLRSFFSTSTIKGMNNAPSFGFNSSDFGANNGALTGNPKYDMFNSEFGTPDYTTLGFVFYNYKTRLNLGILKFQFNVLNLDYLYFSIDPSVGILFYTTKMNMFDESGNQYDFGSILNQGVIVDEEVSNNLLSELYDNSYESQAERFDQKVTPFGRNNQPIFGLGLSFGGILPNKDNLSIDFSYFFTGSDLIDGQRWQEWGTLSRDNDNLFRLSLNYSFSLKRKLQE